MHGNTQIKIGFHLYTLFTILSSGIRCKWPNQLNLCAFVWFITFFCVINSSNSSFVFILHVPSLYFVGPKISLNTFLSDTIDLFFYCSFQNPCFTSIRYYWSYQWLRRCVTNRKVAGSIPDGVIVIFHWHNPSDRTMALASTQPLTEVSTRRISWG